MAKLPELDSELTTQKICRGIISTSNTKSE
jgi:hypothetical protein